MFGSYPLSTYANGDPAPIQTFHVDLSGDKKSTKDAIEVVFENKLGKPVELWTEDGIELTLVASLNNLDSAIVSTFIGETFHFTPPGSGGSHEHMHYQKKLTRLTNSVILYDKETMKTMRKNEAGCGKDGRCNVILVNKSGQSLNVYWRGRNGNGVLQGQGGFATNSEMTLYTHVGHEFYLTPSKDPKKELFELKVTKQTSVVTLGGKAEL